ncbi:Acetyltransferase (GNAT) domain-containing protein [Maribacter sedimenticola]|uniref:Acetyltransferase (GNAT) domain-containing protein n=1 Tax=Maribacter sedimenticola TaxID=228956 RepID=A0ABY1SGW9_9FLAO|nr:GNAT family N-acetyltransferase [Maribacter sedimenticola]SNR47565.1 Acetyltransferase (GNAT) domain-containing protein [Maribacter sedimenticola]
MPSYTIKQITIEEALPIRHKVMWPNETIDYVRLPEDDEGTHYGLIIDSNLIAVISLFIKGKEAQFRKFATLHEYQGKGYGTILLNAIMNIAAENNLTRIWCNARTSKTNFYAKFNMQLTPVEFIKGGLNYVIMERNFH